METCRVEDERKGRDLDKHCGGWVDLYWHGERVCGVEKLFRLVVHETTDPSFFQLPSSPLVPLWLIKWGGSEGEVYLGVGTCFERSGWPRERALCQDTAFWICERRIIWHRMIWYGSKSSGTESGGRAVDESSEEVVDFILELIESHPVLENSTSNQVAKVKAGLVRYG
ncbi:hypothetical protein JAAARDRAFT_408254 [Jaapia argillacea MUCL 33604]|uniref:Uncharacterized protein n=1 Tax=Jaapia argillacea MUCL 33604 TaxID=933084 RepID=A0A067PI41_9AGAM|nr:hypothetical protein JAAARDRAFT_408254 [Jaapia argillacea MUCL 33604]